MVEKALTLKKNIAANLKEPLPVLVTALQTYAANGGSQVSAHKVLEELRSEVTTESEEDRVLELLDIVCGFCSLHLRIWASDNDPQR